MIARPIDELDPTWADDESPEPANANDPSSGEPSAGTTARPRVSSSLPWDDADGCRRLPTLSSLDPLPHWARGMVWGAKPGKNGEEVYALRSCEANVMAILRHDRRWRGVLAFDEMAHKVTTILLPPWYGSEPGTTIGRWEDSDPVRLVAWLQSAYGLGIKKSVVADCALVAAEDRRFHPVRAWLEALPPHDGTPRVKAFFPAYFGATDNEYTRAVGVVLLVSMVARAMVAGSKVDTVVVLEGDQGLKKSTACKAIAGEAWFAEATSEIGTKDAQLAMHGKWLLEMPELAAMTKAQAESVKAFFSRATDWLRPPYARAMADLKRSSVSVATTNDERYLKDRTGNRRWLPVACKRIDVSGIRRDREQLFAEALAIYRAGRAWWIDDPSVLALAREQAERRETIDPWEERLREWARGVSAGTNVARGIVGVTTADALAYLQVPIERQSDREAARVGTILRRLGMVDHRPRDREAEAEANARGETYQRARRYRWQNPDANEIDE